MEVVKIDKEALVMNKKERDQLLQCLRYCRHRVASHNKTQAGNGSFLSYAIAFLETMEEGK